MAPIQDEDTYQHALNTLNELLTKLDSGTLEDDDLLNELSDRVEEYEAIHFPIPEPDPEDLLRFRMDQQGY